MLGDSNTEVPGDSREPKKPKITRAEFDNAVAMELMDGAGVPVQKDGKPLDLVQRVILLIEDREQIQEAWSNYMEFLKRKYPPYPGYDFELTCPHHRRINEVLK